ncbi:MAG TPA: polysaccharide biosynthesis tyrosine autokinase [Thermoanaerobaculia bacterium]|nr:polysaccharide biosynthesis tyrosine autokinase [Thermoanaerobaculia bacterium]
MDLNTHQEIHLSHYWSIIRKRWPIAVSILVVVMLGTFLVSYFAKPLYRGAIQIQIERDNPNQMTLEDLFGIQASDQEFLQTQYVLLKSRGLAQRVIDEHKLLSDPDFYPAGIAGKSPEEVRQIRDNMASSLLGSIEVQAVRNTSIVEISAIAATPRLAQKVAEGWGESFVRMNIEKKLDTVRQASEYLARQITAVKADLEVSRQQLQRYGESKDIVSVDSSGNTITVQRLLQLNADLTSAQNETIQKRAEYESVMRSTPEAITANDPIVARFSDELSRLQRDYNEKLRTLLPGHPAMQQLSGQIEKTRQARDAAARQAWEKARDAARASWTAAQSREESTRSALNAQKHETQQVNASAAGYTDLRSEIETKQTLLTTLQKQLNETEVAARLRGSASSNVHWVEHAQLPGGRFNVSMKKNLQNAFPLGIILGLATIFFLEYMDRSIKTPEELERVTKFASLGIIPAAESLRGGGSRYSYGRTTPKLRAVEADGPRPTGIELIPHTDSRSPVAEAYRAFRTSLLLASAASPKVIVITSSFAREGKTTTSMNLATVLAQMGKPVLLVDADLRRPRLQRVFSGKMNLGLVNYLAANIPLDDIIQPTEVPHLSVVLSGPIPPNPSELLASDRMKHLIEEVRGKYAFVIFDSPPILAVTDAVVLGANADGIVLTVHGGQTPRELAQRSAERLRQANVPVLGAILNNLNLQQYGYTYRKSYYDYYVTEETAEEDKRSRAKSM